VNIVNYGDIIEVTDFIAPAYENHLLTLFSSLKFPWYFNPTLVSPELPIATDTRNISGFNHFLYEEEKPVSTFFETVYPVYLSVPKIKGIRMQKIERMRLNLTLPSTDSAWHLPHIDSPFPHWNAIYYVNTCDGDTVIFNETNDKFVQRDYKTMTDKSLFTVKHRVTPEKGKLVVFPGQYYHSSSFTTNSKYRIVLNMNITSVFDDRLQNL
jgi:hypothetical protein